MNAAGSASHPAGARFRVRVVVAMMLLVSGATTTALYFAQRNLAATIRRDFDRGFQAGLRALHDAAAMRHAVLAERCRALVRRPRIHAALEDNAPDLLYPSAQDELQDLLAPADPADPLAPPVLHAVFYRFLDSRGAVIHPADTAGVGPLDPAETAALALPAVPGRPQAGYLRRTGTDTIVELIALPIVSTETGEAIAALVLGFAPPDLNRTVAPAGLAAGLWTGGQLYSPALSASSRPALADATARAIAATPAEGGSLTVSLAGVPHLLFFQRINPGSAYPPAYEVCVGSLAPSLAHQRQLRWQYVAAGGLLLLAAFGASRYLSFRLAVPVEKLAVDSEINRARWQHTAAALENTHEELQRSARFSANASHQLKTPVTVLRAGLEELLAGEKLAPEMRDEVSALVHQTFRLTGIIEDLLLLSRMDAGHLQIDFRPLDLTPLIAALLDDVSALPDPLGLTIETDLPASLTITGERRYASLILQNLLENARKYNRAGGRVHIAARREDDYAVVAIRNTGAAIPAEAQTRIFERFHRGTAGENVPGHGLGLNLARELARVHRGDLRLVSSDENWTRFEVRFVLASADSATGPAPP